MKKNFKRIVAAAIALILAAAMVLSLIFTIFYNMQ